MTGGNHHAFVESVPQQHQRRMVTDPIHCAQARAAEIGCAFHPPAPTPTPDEIDFAQPNSSGAFNSLFDTCDRPHAAGTFALLTD